MLHELHQLPHLLSGEYQFFLATGSSPTWLARKCATCRICSNMSNTKNLSAQKLYLVISGYTTCAHVPSRGPSTVFTIQTLCLRLYHDRGEDTSSSYGWMGIIYNCAVGIFCHLQLHASGLRYLGRGGYLLLTCSTKTVLLQHGWISSAHTCQIQL